MVDLRTTYMGWELSSPIIASASPLSMEVENIKQMEDAGAGAVVLYSIFEEQIRYEKDSFSYLAELGAKTFSEALDYYPVKEDGEVRGMESYLDLIRKASESVDMPVIASLNGISEEGWIEYAKQFESAGAKGLELNIFFIPSDLSLTGRDVEQKYIDILKSVKQAISIPVAVKLNPYFSSMGHMAKQLDEAGADALVLFNRFYQPDFDIQHLEVENNLQLSTAEEIRLPLLWIGLLYNKLSTSIAATTGVQGATEVLKYLLAGADAVMTTSALLKHGISHIQTMLTELETWMRLRDFGSIQELRGLMSQEKVKNPVAYERANYLKILDSDVDKK